MLVATRGLVPILVDCSEKGSQQEMQSKYNVQGYPTAIYTDPEGKVLREMGTREAASLAREIDSLVKKYPGRPSIWQNTQKGALENGKKPRRPVVVYVAPPDADVFKMTLKLQKDLGDRKAKFLYVYQKGTAEALAQWKVDAAPAAVVLDPGGSDDAPVATIALKPDDKADVLNKALDEAAKKIRK